MTLYNRKIAASAKLAMFAILLAVVYVSSARADFTATATVDMGSYQGEMLVIPETLSGKHFITVPDSGLLYVYDRDMDATSSYVLDAIGGSRPWGMGVYDNGAVSKIYIADRNAFRVFVYEEATTSINPTTITVGTNPIGIAVNSDPAEMVGYVANSMSNSVSVIDVMTDSVVKTITKAGMIKPWGVAVNETTNKVFVASLDNGRIFVFEGKAGLYAYVAEIQVFATPTYIEVNEDDNLLYVTHQSVNYLTIIDCSDYSVKEAKNLGAAAYGVAYQPDLGFYYVSMKNSGSVIVFDSNTDEMLDGSDNPLAGFTNPKGIAMITPGLGGGGNAPWYVGVVDSSGRQLRQVLTTETYAPSFGGIISASDAGDNGTPSVYLQYDEAQDTTPPITYYVYSSATSGVYSDPPWTTPLFGTVTYNIGINYGDKVYFKVHAVDNASPPNESTNIEEAYAIVTDGVPPTGGELTIAADTTQGREVDLTWTPGVDDHGPITFNIYVALVSGAYNWSSPYAQVVGGTTYTLNDLQNNSTYYFVVRAEDTGGLMNENNTELSATPTDTVAPVFGGLTGIGDDATGGSVNLSWVAATDNSGPITYNLYYEQGAVISSYATPQQTVSGVTIFKVTGLTNDVQYVFAVRAKDAQGNEDANVVELTETPTDPTAPTFDGVYSCEDMGNDDEIRLAWNSATDNSLPITYNIYSATLPGIGNYNLASTSYQTPATIYTASGLTLGQEYYFIVRAEDAAGNEDANVVEAGPCTPTDGVLPDFDGIQTATATRVSGEINITWNNASDTSLPITYNVYDAVTSGGQTFGTPTLSTVATGVTIGGLLDGQSYYYVVRAEDFGSLEDSNTNEFEVVPNDGTAPVFAGISALTDAGTYGTLQASWAAAADPTAPVSYNIFVSDTGSFNFAATPYANTSLTSIDISGLTNNMRYGVVVRAVDGAGVTSLDTIPMFATPTDSTPPVFGGISGVTDTGAGGKLTIGYPAAVDSSTPVKYHIFMATSPNPINYTTADYITTSSAYSVTGLQNGTLYTFSVWAEDAATPSNFATNAAVLGGTPSDVIAPIFAGVKTAQSAAGMSDAVTLTWTAATDYSTPITYSVYYHTNNVAANIVAQGVRATTTATFMTITNLANGTYWYFVVRAKDAEGNSESNVIVKGAVPQDLKAPVFTGLSSASDTTVGGEVSLAWTAASDSSPVLFYNLYYGVGSCGDTVKKTTTQLSYSLTGLTDNSGYCFEVGAEDGAANETRGVQLFATPTDQTPPVFTGLGSAADTTKGGEILLSWTTATDRSTPIYYNIYESTTPGGFSFGTPTYQTTNVSSYTVTGLTNGQLYYYIVAAQDSSTYANESATMPAKTSTPTDTSPPAFSGLGSVVVVSENGIVELSWSTATDNSAPIYYNIYKSSISNNFGGFAAPYSTVTGTTTAQVSGLIDDKYYFFVVRAEDSASPPNETTNTTQTSYQFHDTVEPNPVSGIQAVAGDVSSATGDEYIKITWISPTMNADGSPLVDLTGYDVLRGTSPGVYSTTVNTTLVASTATSFMDTTCVELIPYYYVVIGYDDAGNESALSDQVESKCINSDDKIPVAPSGLAAAASDGQVTLSWDKPTLNTDGSVLKDLQGYNVRRSETQGANYAMINSSIVLAGSGGSKEIYVDTDVVNDTTYYYVVTALDTSDPANESEYSDEVTATPGTAPDFPPAAPSSLLVSASAGSAYLNWTAPTKNSDGSDIASDLAGYNVYRSENPASGWTKRNSSIVVPPSYTDADLSSGVMYYYYVTALDNAAQESASSSQAIAIYGDKGITGRIRFRDPNSPTPTGYLLTGVPLMEVYLVNAAGETLVTSYTSADGSFTLVYEAAELGVPYDVRLKVEDGSGFPYDVNLGNGEGYLVLAHNIYIGESGFNQIIPEPTSIGVGPTLGDMNCDGQVNLFDITVLKPAYGSQTGDPDYVKNADANGDGSINLQDISVLKGYFGHQTMTLPAGACD